MSWLKALLGAESPEQIAARAEKLYSDRRFGEAKLAFERAAQKVAKGAASEEAVASSLEGRVAACCDALAAGRIAEARGLLKSGQLDLAYGELTGALEVARSADLIAEAQGLLDGLEQRNARQQQIDAGQDLGEEDHYAVLAGSWEEEQAEEYDAYGESFVRAVLDLHAERSEQALAALKTLAEQHPDGRYLQLELGKAALLHGDDELGRASIACFLERLEPGEGGEARLVAHMELARIADEADDFDGAVAQLQSAVDSLDGDPRPSFALGRFLRTKGHHAEAADVLEAAASLMSELQPDWRVLQELGLAQMGAGQADRALETLEGVVELLTARQHLDFPPQTVVALAQLHEEAGRKERAADLYRSLTQGSDTENHAHYHCEAARLLTDLGLEQEARRMLQRASALCQDDPQLSEEVQQRLGQLAELIGTRG